MAPAFLACRNHTRVLNEQCCLQAVKTLTQVSDDLKPLMLQDLRIQCRARGISPAGSRPTLLERLAEHMMATDN